MGIIAKVKNLSLLGIGDIISSGSLGIFMLYLASQMEPENYGQLIYLTTLASMVSVTTLVISPHTITVFTAKNFKITTVVNVITIIVSGIGSIIIFLLLEEKSTAFLVFAYAISAISIADMLGKKEFSKYSKFVIAQKGMLIVFSLILYEFVGITGVILGMSLSNIPYIFLVLRQSKRPFDWETIKTKRKYIFWNYVLKLIDSLKGFIDKLILVPLVGFVLLGNYSLSFQIIAGLTIFPTIIFKYILPLEASGSSQKSLKQFSFIISVCLALLGSFLLPIVIPSLLPKYVEVIDAIRIMSFGIIPISVNLFFWSKFLANEETKIILISRGITIGTITIGFILVSESFGIIGISIIFVLAHCLETISFLIFTRGSKL